MTTLGNIQKLNQFRQTGARGTLIQPIDDWIKNADKILKEEIKEEENKNKDKIINIDYLCTDMDIVPMMWSIIIHYLKN